MNESLRRFYRNPNYLILFSFLILIFIGCVAIFSATYSLDANNEMLSIHLIYILIGIFFFFLFTFIKKETLYDLSLILYSICVLMLLSLIILKYLHIVESPARWIQIGSKTFQPSEFMKISLVLFLGRIFTNDKLSKNQMYLYAFIASAIPIILILLEPDLGTAIILIVVFLMMCFISKLGIPYVIFTIIAGVLIILVFKKYLFYDYQIKRFLSFLNPVSDPMGEGWSINQALIAIGSGGFFGKGFLRGTQSKMGFLPNTQYSDFIFSVIGEEFGFFGCLMLIIFFAILLISIINIAMKSDDYFYKIIVNTIFGFLTFQFLTNIGMNIGLLPVTGIPLPFISYGGSALISNISAIGIVYNSQINRKSIEF
jgi:rod shape determining protein RodA